MSTEANQPVSTGEVTQDDKNNASIIQGLVLGSGLLGFIPFLGFLGWICSVAVIVLYFVWKDKGELVRHHAKQGLGLQIILIAVGILVAIISTIVVAASFGAAVRGSVGAFGAMGGLSILMTVISVVMNLGAAALGLFGLLAAQKGEKYTYPVIGNMIENFGKK